MRRYFGVNQEASELRDTLKSAGANKQSDGLAADLPAHQRKSKDHNWKLGLAVPEWSSSMSTTHYHLHIMTADRVFVDHVSNSMRKSQET